MHPSFLQLLEAAIRAADMDSVQELLPRLATSPLLGYGVLQAACCGCALFTFAYQDRDPGESSPALLSALFKDGSRPKLLLCPAVSQCHSTCLLHLSSCQCTPHRLQAP